MAIIHFKCAPCTGKSMMVCSLINISQKVRLRKEWIVRHFSIIDVHYDDVIMGTTVSLITSLTIVYSTVYPDGDRRKHQSSASLAFVWGIHRGPVNSPHKWPVTREMFPFDDVIMFILIWWQRGGHVRKRLLRWFYWTEYTLTFINSFCEIWNMEISIK